ncbi:MAG: methylenetetrahydrofolate reductase [NAD(P)H] [Alphaproteobacteria bacterium]|nr:methylenetetrahydrofolate reductase [NAD(P)H] [Alphaproteobacteria bacterium]
MTGAANISFEFFPPKTEALEASLLKVAETLAPYRPAFVSVTYGAGGSTRDRTHRLVVKLQNDLKLQAAAHLTCVGATKAEIEAIAMEYWSQGITHIVALRGDPPENEKTYRPYPSGYAYAVDLLLGLKRLAAFQISVAAYPEVHPEAPSPDADMGNLKRKIDAGAVRAVTQFFLDTGIFLRFRDKAVRMGIKVPVVPGILPIASFERVCVMAQKCGVHVPDEVRKRFDGLLPGTPAHRSAALEIGLKQIEALKRNGVENFHFFTLNRAELVAPLCDAVRGGS